MTYIDYINQFWQTQANVEFSPNEAYLYFFLLKECNSRGWENPFECPNRKIVLSIGVSEPTMIDCRNRLQQKGLINDLSKPLSKTFSKSLSKTFSKSLSSNKDLRLKIDNSGELFPPSPKEKPKKQPNGKRAEFVPPTLNEVREFFRDRLPDWEAQAELFFAHYDGLGWHTSTGVKVQRWDSMANKWITEKQIKANERQNNTDRRRADKEAKVRQLAAEYAALAQGYDAGEYTPEIPDL